MTGPQLGKVDLIEDLRTIWPDEARDFTPWLATEDGLELLGQAIHAKLELVEKEAEVGPFSADLLARLVGKSEPSSLRISLERPITTTWANYSPTRQV
jgi:hypothetical protein